MAKFPLAFRPKGRKKIKVAFFPDAFSRNLDAKILTDQGYKVRKLKPKGKVV